MNTLNDDVFILVLSYLQPEDIVLFYNKYPLILENLKSHIGFVVHCHQIVSQEIIHWFHQKQIQLSLLHNYICAKDGEFWYQNGQLHRDNDEPAVINYNSHKMWYQHGLLHRDNGLPAIISSFSEEWYEYGLRHRNYDLPARIVYQYKKWYLQEWYQHGLLHRENDLPATIRPNNMYGWFKHGKQYFCKKTILLQKMNSFLVPNPIKLNEIL